MNAVQRNGATLAIIDADRIHEYVFSPRQLRLVRGASGLQAKLNLEMLPDLLKSDQIVYAGGGTLLAEFENAALAELYCQKAAQLFREQTGTGSVSYAIAEPLPEGGFLDQWQEVRRRLEEKKTGRRERRAPASNPYWKRCEACGLHPAQQLTPPLPEGERASYCDACLKRLDHSRESRYFTAIKRTAKHGLGYDTRSPSDFEELGSQSTPPGYLALIYIDGDRLGKFLGEHVNSRADFEHWSERIREGMQSAIFEAAAGLCGAGNSVAPFEVLLIGGDDALVAVAAHRALDYLTAFDDEFRKVGLSYSAGIVFAHSHYPIANGIAEAEELLRSAKSAGGAKVDFRVITGSAADTPGVDENAKAHTRRPYTIDDLLALTGHIRSWKKAGVPRNKIRDLYRLAYEEKQQAEFEYLYIRSRLSKDHREQFDQVFANTQFWQDGRTPAADLVELWEFV